MPAFDEAVASFVRGVLGDERIRGAVAAFVARLVAGLAHDRAGAEGRAAHHARASPTPTRAPSCGTCRWSTPTTAGRSTTTRGGRCWPLDAVPAGRRRPAPPSCTWCRGCCACGATGPSCSSTASSYAPLDAGTRAVAYVRGGSVVTVAPTRALQVERSGWGDDAVELPDGPLARRPDRRRPRRRPGAARRAAGRLPGRGPAPRADPHSPRSNRSPGALAADGSSAGSGASPQACAGVTAAATRAGAAP